MLLGNCNGLPDRPVTLLDGIKAALPKATVRYVPGCEFTKDIMEGGQHQGAAEIAAMSDVVIACLGLSPSQEGEEGCGEGDRSAIELPEVQTRLLQAVAKTGKPVVVVLTGGSAIAANWCRTMCPRSCCAGTPDRPAARPSPRRCWASTTPPADCP